MLKDEVNNSTKTSEQLSRNIYALSKELQRKHTHINSLKLQIENLHSSKNTLSATVKTLQKEVLSLEAKSGTERDHVMSQMRDITLNYDNGSKHAYEMMIMNSELEKIFATEMKIAMGKYQVFHPDIMMQQTALLKFRGLM